MDRYFNVEWTVHNADSDAWLSKVPDGGGSTDEMAVKRLFHSECDRLFGSADFDYVCVLYRDNYGRVIDSDVKDIRVAPVPPEPNEE